MRPKEKREKNKQENVPILLTLKMGLGWPVWCGQARYFGPCLMTVL